MNDATLTNVSAPAPTESTAVYAAAQGAATQWLRPPPPKTPRMVDSAIRTPPPLLATVNALSRETVGKRVLLQLRSVGKNRARAANSWEKPWENDLNFFPHVGSASTVVRTLNLICGGAGNGARTRDLNFGKYTTAVLYGLSASTPSRFDHELSRSVGGRPCLSVVKATCYHEKSYGSALFTTVRSHRCGRACSRSGQATCVRSSRYEACAQHAHAT
jgi:hypothetical protein